MFEFNRLHTLTPKMNVRRKKSRVLKIFSDQLETKIWDFKKTPSEGFVRYTKKSWFYSEGKKGPQQ